MASLLETLSKGFFGNKETKEDLTINNPEKIIDDLGSDYDMSQLISSNLYGHQNKKEELTNSDIIKSCRKLYDSPEASIIIDEIVNEFYNTTKEELPRIDLGSYEMPKTLVKKINTSFEKILNILDFRRNGTDLIKSWYVDGHLFLECVYDNKKPKDGIKMIGQLDPIGITKVYDEKLKKNIYLYTNANAGFFGDINNQSTRYMEEQLIYVNSGKKNKDGKIVSYLQPAVKIYNQMEIIEDILVVYRITRGSEKRAIKVNLGNMPKTKAVNYMNELVNKFKYKKTYNSNTGTIENNSHIMSLTEDIWLPTKGSTKDIEIDTIAGGMSLGELEDLVYFRNKLLMSLRVPANRFSEDSNGIDITATEINREEMRFAQFVGGLRLKFNEIFVELLKRELIITNTMSEKEFSELRKHIRIVFPDESMILKRQFYSKLERKLEVLSSIESYVGTYYSKEWVRKNILELNEEEIESMKEQIEKEKKEEPQDDGYGY